MRTYLFSISDNLLASLEALKLESDVTKHEKLLDEIIENVDKDGK